MKFMHRNVYRLVRPLSRQARCSSFLVILTKSYTIPQQDLPKPHYFARRARGLTLTRCRNAKRTLAPERCEGSYLKLVIYLRLGARGRSRVYLRLSARRRRDARRTRQQDEPGCRVAPAHILPAQRCTRPFRARGTSAL